MSVGQAGDLFGAAVAVAVLAAMESLLSARVADGMADVPAHDSDRELFGQGLANIISPVFGGMPATGAIARTARKLTAKLDPRKRAAKTAEPARKKVAAKPQTATARATQPRSDVALDLIASTY